MSLITDSHCLLPSDRPEPRETEETVERLVLIPRNAKLGAES